MIVLLAKNTVKEGMQEAFLKLAQEMCEYTRKEAGCIRYEVAADKADPQGFYFIETYQTEEALELHRQTAYFQTLVPQIAALRVKPSEVSICTVLT